MTMIQYAVLYLASTGVLAFCLLAVIWTLYKRIKTLEDREADLLLEWHAWAASQIEDYGTARIMAGLSREKKKQSAGATSTSMEPVVPVIKQPKEAFVIKQSG